MYLPMGFGAWSSGLASLARCSWVTLRMAAQGDCREVFPVI